MKSKKIKEESKQELIKHDANDRSQGDLTTGSSSQAETGAKITTGNSQVDITTASSLADVTTYITTDITKASSQVDITTADITTADIITDITTEITTDEELKNKKSAQKEPGKRRRKSIKKKLKKSSWKALKTSWKWFKAGMVYLSRQQLEMVTSWAYCPHYGVNPQPAGRV